MAAMITSMLIIPRKPTINLSTFHRTLASKRCRISSNATATSFKPCSSQRSIDVKRRSGNYKSPFWDFDYIQSLNSEYKEERYLRRASALKVQVKMLMEEAVRSLEAVEQLELIDNLQRLGISYHFVDQIKNILNALQNDKHGKNYQTMERNLYSTALEFRLLRQHGFEASQELFDDFKNMEDGEFKASLGEDTKGLLQLYESSFLLTQGENTLDQAREFATKFLQKNLDQKLIIDENLLLLVHHALEIPLHWSVPRTNARWFIEAYERRSDMNPIVLELAKLDFNIVQAIHQEELKHVSRWWKSTCLTRNLPFVRDRVVEAYVWSLGMIEPPEYGYQRSMSVKVIGLVTTVDDIFDVYGTLEELQLFTDAFQRWDIELIDQLPDYMQVCYLAVYNIINEVAYDVLKDEGYIIIKYLRKSIEMERGDLRKAVQCYMNETGASDKDAQEYIWSLVREAWKKINGESVANSPFSQAFITSLVNAGRMTHYTYKYGDGHGVQPSNVKDEIKDLLFHHIV